MLARMNIGASIPLDQDLLAKIASRDEAAFALLLDRHLENVRALAWRVLANHEDVDDIAQEVFLKLWKNPQSFTPGNAKFSTWLYRITLNACIDRQRRTKTANIIPIGEFIETTVPDNAPTPEGAAINTSRSGRVAQAIARLPERQRHAIALSHFQELSNIEAASAMETTVEAVESLLGRARRSLKNFLQNDIAELLDGTGT
ncbi:hypothetical protein MNBD_ALPHA08-278 [hydrothermal vent metagenome]|uniref:RNA polymerase ECF-type sigma factor n=1 Tax=hydrothermal vent metagenome TaxID=652676 RepID=A0A3B0S4I7_9ZZZZ